MGRRARCAHLKLVQSTCVDAALRSVYNLHGPANTFRAKCKLLAVSVDMNGLLMACVAHSSRVVTEFST